MPDGSLNGSGFKRSQGFQVQSEDKFGNLPVDGSLHFVEEPETVLFIFYQGVALAVSPQIHATAQIFHHLQMVDPEEVDGLENNATQSAKHDRSVKGHP